MSAIVFLCFGLLPSAFCPCFAGSVRTLDGRTLEGDVKLEQSGQITVTPVGGKPQKLTLDDVFQADFRPDLLKPIPGAAPKVTPPPPALREGLMLRSGTLLAGAQIEKADDAGIAFNKSGRRATFSHAKFARIIFSELPAELAAKIPEKRTGVLLKEGDFVEGDFRGIQGGRVLMSSVLFGLTRLEPRQKALAVVLNDLDPGRPDVVIRTVDGSVYVGSAVTADKDKLTIEDAVAGPFAIARAEVVEYAAGAGRLESLSALKPQKVEPAPKMSGEGLTINSTGVPLPMTLGALTFDRGVTLTAGAAATWDLAAKYRTLTFKCGVPRGVLATAPVRFIVHGDGKELYKSRPRTSLDEPCAASVALKGVKTLTLKVESTAGDSLTTPGLWADAALIK